MKRSIQSSATRCSLLSTSKLLFFRFFGMLVLIVSIASCSSPQPKKDTQEQAVRSPAGQRPFQTLSRAGRDPLKETPLAETSGLTPGASAGSPKGPAPLAEEKKSKSTPVAPDASSAPRKEAAPKGEEPQYVMLNFENAQLPDVVRTIMEILGYNYIIDPQVAGVLNIHTSGKVPRGDLFPILETILKIYNAAVVKEGTLYHIRPVGPAKGSVPSVVPRGQLPPGDSLIIQVIPLHFIPADEMAKILKPFQSPGSIAQPYAKENLLVIMDFASNIRKFLSLVDLFDIDIFQKVSVKLFPLKFSLAQDVVQELEGIFGAYDLPGKKGRELGVKFIPIQRLNAILSISSIPGAIDQVEQWVEKLDRTSEENIVRVFVYRCQNQKAGDIVKVLEEVYGKREQPREERRTTERQPTRPGRPQPRTQAGTYGAVPGSPPPAAAAPVAAPTVSPAPAAPPGSAPAPPSAKAPEAAPAPAPEAAPAGVAPPAAAPSIEATAPGEAGLGARTEYMADVAGFVSFHVDAVTNSLIIRASERDYRTILKTIQQLDIFPRQVLIEVVVAEISLDESMALGFEWQKFSAGSATSYALGVLGGANSILPGLEYSVVKAQELQATLRAIAARNKVDILSSPHIIASDNSPASINISDEIPIITGQVTTTNATAGTQGTRTVDQTVEYRSVGIILTVTPNINDMGLVRMDIQQTVSEVSDKTVAGVSSPVFFNRTAKTIVTVNDSQTIVIGGLIREKKDRVRSGVPFLYKIPVLGFLFGFDSHQVNKTELMILITPHVIRSLDDADVVTREFQNKVKAIQESMKAYQ